VQEAIMAKLRAVTLVGAVVTGLLWSAAGADACVGTQAVTTCNTTCTSNCYLYNDINCTTGQGITLSSGVDLDMCGRSLTCTSLICASKAAVTMSASGSQVDNSASGSGFISKIAGPWSTGVDCASKGSSRVSGIRFENNYGNSVVDCHKIDANVVINAGGWAFVVNTGVTNTDQIVDNYVQSSQAISISSSTNFDISHNLFAMDPNVPARGIDATAATGSFSIADNIFMNEGTPIEHDTSTSGTYSDNFCDPFTSGCASCKTNGECDAPQVPFVMP
jgi:hypothetical protein